MKDMKLQCFYIKGFALQGFKRLADSLSDLELDLPDAREGFECIKETAEMQGWLPDAGPAEDLPRRNSSALFKQPSLKAFKESVLAALKEYQVSGDAEEVALCLADLKQPGFHSIVVKQVTLATAIADMVQDATIYAQDVKTFVCFACNLLSVGLI